MFFPRNFRRRVLLALLAWSPALWLGVTPGVRAVGTNQTDVCIYGGTSGGVVAAVQAARMGKSVVIVEPGGHLGGMSASGLGATDLNIKAAVGGLSREFYQRVGQQYSQSVTYLFEPRVAEQVFSNMLAELSVPVHFQQQVASVQKSGPRLTRLTTADGTVFQARMFIDASYQGDLMALAGVAHGVGREAQALYGETLAGINDTSPTFQFNVPVDPYLTPGETNSGLIPLVQAGNVGNLGNGDGLTQAYNYRLCLTQVASNRLAILPPPGYTEARYELLARYVEALVAQSMSPSLNDFFWIVPLPNGKADFNNRGPISTDYVSGNTLYAQTNAAGRAQIELEHQNYMRGLIYFMATSPRIPANVRTNMASWGLCLNEFQSTGGWPHQIYLREGRRMVSDYVMQEANILGTRVATDPIGLGEYPADSHVVKRVVKDGLVRNEGLLFVNTPAPYPTSYRSIVPAATDCDNLFVTFCLSASHVAFGSLRMEPVFMNTCQSAATAVGSSRVDLQACKLEYSIVSPK